MRIYTKKDIASLPENLRRFTNPGVYVVILSLFYMFMNRRDSFYESGYDVMSYPFVLIYDPSTVRKRNQIHFPQKGSDLALVARLTQNGPSSNRFKPSFNGSFQSFQENTSHYLSSMYNIPLPNSKVYISGSCIPYEVTEKPIAMLSELEDLFTSQGGLVLDPFAGTSTTDIACFKTGRGCTSIEKNSDCFQSAIKRLQKHLPFSSLINNISVEPKTVNAQNEVFRTLRSTNCSEMPQWSNKGRL